MSTDREKWFAALKLDLFEMALHPTLYGQEDHGEIHADALNALVSLTDIAKAAEDLADRTITDLIEVGRLEAKLRQLLRAARNSPEAASARATNSQADPRT